MLLPANSAVERIFPTCSPARTETSLDTKTIFYDIYIDPVTRRLCGIGPRLYNLETEIFPLDIFVGSKRIDFFITKVKKQFFLESKYKIEPSEKLVDITLRFKSFECSFSLNNSSTDAWLVNSSNSRLTICTLQKDNHIVWIKDWIKWHCRLYGVKRVILYDNGSENQQELITSLREVTNEVELIFVHWEFPYGRAPNFYAQTGMLNHCRIRFSPLEDIEKLRGGVLYQRRY